MAWVSAHHLGRYLAGSRSREHDKLQVEQKAISDMTNIEIRPCRGGCKAFEAPGVELVFLTKEQAIDYATGRVCFRSGEIRIVGSGAVERIIPFNESDRKL